MSTLARYIIIAITAYIIDMGGYYLLVQLGWQPVAANVIVKVFAAVCGFFMHRRFTYQIKDEKDMANHAKKYFGLALIYTPVSSAVLFLLLLVIVNPIYAKATSDVLLFVATYWITTKFTFTRPAADGASPNTK